MRRAIAIAAEVQDVDDGRRCYARRRCHACTDSSRKPECLAEIQPPRSDLDACWRARATASGLLGAILRSLLSSQVFWRAQRLERGTCEGGVLEPGVTFMPHVSSATMGTSRGAGNIKQRLKF
jgi:hypothetical protein